jgi:hypothetical protein
MKRWYIVPKSVWEEDDPRISQPRHAWLFGSSYVELDDDHLLACTDFAKDHHEEAWHDHPEIARLAHPQLEQDLPIAHLVSGGGPGLQAGVSGVNKYAHKQFKSHHFDKLKALCAQHGHQLNDQHTLWDVHDVLIQHYPGLKLSRY